MLHVWMGGVIALLVAMAAGPTPGQAPGQGQPEPVLRLQPGERIIEWSGLDWLVKDSRGANVGPGPCLFDPGPENVWVDQSNRLHLRITRRSGKPHCAEVVCRPSFGYGTYQFVVDGVKNLDPLVVGGLFTWDNESDQYAHRELDFEYGYWSDTSQPNFQAVVQPYTNPGNLNRYRVPLTGMIHSFEWTPTQITYRSVGTDGKPYKEWVYKGKDIPKPGREQARINLWLFQGRTPTVQGDPEMILRLFRFTPYGSQPGPKRQ